MTARPGGRGQPGGGLDGRLTPQADPVTGLLGWQVTTRSRRLAGTIAAACGGTAGPDPGGGWAVRISRPDLEVTIVGAGAGVLWCSPGSCPQTRVLALAHAPWPAGTVLGTPLPTLPAPGHLTIRETKITTRMGRTIRYLIPQFTRRPGP